MKDTIKYPKLKEYAYIVPIDSRSCQIGTVPGKAVVIDADIDMVKTIVGLFDGKHTTDELREILATNCGLDIAQIRSLIDNLCDTGLLENALIPSKKKHLERYNSQLKFLSIFSSPSKPSYKLLETLRTKTVGVIGAGGMGCHALSALALAGVGKLIVVDYDTISPSNLNRQILYREEDVGLPKPRVACNAIKKLNPDVLAESRNIKVSSLKEARRAVKGVDFVLCSADFPFVVIHRCINEACVELDIPWMQVNLGETTGTVGPLVIPHKTACFECLEGQYRKHNPNYDFQINSFLESSESSEETYHKRSATLGACIGVIGNLAAWETIRYLTEIAEPVTVGHLATLDILSMKLEREPISRLEQCSVCGNPAGQMNITKHSKM